ncbi:hypothetical protein MMC11_001019 [Xylographa trunciseda]|nr:hypothetical protein [Xylographa trunciseda]
MERKLQSADILSARRFAPVVAASVSFQRGDLTEDAKVSGRIRAEATLRWHKGSSGWIGDWMINGAARTHGGQDIATRYQFGLAQRLFETTLRAMNQYTFKLGGDGTAEGSGKSKDYLEKVKCPVLVTAAAADPASFLPELSTDAIMKNLANVGKGQKKLWVAKTYSEGGAKAKSGAWHLLQHRAYIFLDEALGITKAQARCVDASRET